MFCEILKSVTVGISAVRSMTRRCENVTCPKLIFCCMFDPGTAKSAVMVWVTATILRPPSGVWIFASATAFASLAFTRCCAKSTKDLNVALYPLMSSAMVALL